MDEFMDALFCKGYTTMSQHGEKATHSWPSDDKICHIVHESYARLPKTGKPQLGEWTVLAGVVLSRPGAVPQVVALGTGTKCLTAAQIAADCAGACLHDAHAEVCARRAFLVFLLAEVRRAASCADSPVVQDKKVSSGGFELKPGVAFHFYSSEAPCGDAAIFPLSPMASGSCESDETPAKRFKITGARPADPSALVAEAASCGSACALGLVRTKPGRGERTSCMSCSDKLARWHNLGVQGALLSLLLPDPIRFASVTIGEPSCLEALSRALRRGEGNVATSRTSAATDRILLPEQPRLGLTSHLFEHAATRTDSILPLHPCSNSVIWSAHGLSEAINGTSGKRLGSNKKSPSPKHRSLVCKALLLERFLDVVNACPRSQLPVTIRELPDALADSLGTDSSTEPSSPPLPANYAALKALAIPYQLRKAQMMAAPPFCDWVKAPKSSETFSLVRLWTATCH